MSLFVICLIVHLEFHYIYNYKDTVMLMREASTTAMNIFNCKTRIRNHKMILKKFIDSLFECIYLCGDNKEELGRTMTIPEANKMHLRMQQIYSTYGDIPYTIYVPTDFFTGSGSIGLPQSRLISGLCGTMWHGLPQGDFYMNGPCMSMYIVSYIDRYIDSYV